MSRKNNTRKQNETGSQRQSLSEAKKAAVLGNNENKKKSSLWLVIAAVAVVAGVVGFMATRPSGPGVSVSTAVAGVQETNDAFTFQASTFDDGKARYFRHTTPQGVEVRYFVLKSSDGVIRAAFDACDVCWRANKGYTQDGDFMVCNNCGRRFASVKVNEVQGGCNPAPLKRAMGGDRVIITKADIEAGQNYFNFSS